MTELEHAIKHIKTRADAWAVKEVTEALRSISERLEKAISQECVEPTQKHVENALDMRCDDAISRDAVMGLVAREHTEWDDLYIDIAKLPSVTVRQTGEWKPFDLTYGKSLYICTSCQGITDVPTFMGETMYDFCPNCGAKMESEDKE